MKNIACAWRAQQWKQAKVTLAYDGAAGTTQSHSDFDRGVAGRAGHSNANTDRSADRICRRTGRRIDEYDRDLVPAAEYCLGGRRQRAVPDRPAWRPAADRALWALCSPRAKAGRSRRAAAGPWRLVEHRDWARHPWAALPDGDRMRAV